MSNARVVLRGGIVLDGVSEVPFRGDLAMRDGVITEVGEVGVEDSDVDVDASGRYLMPGFIDTHSHADGAIFGEDVQRALLKQGVTSIIIGQDGVSYAPGDGAYASEYYAALNGPHPNYSRGGVSALLASYDESVPVNVGYLVPAGTVRHEVMGYRPGAASRSDLAAMQALVTLGLAEGALGMSTGLAYVPGVHQNSAELIEMCKPVAAADSIYVTHMRGYETRAKAGTDEITVIVQATGVRVHISHYHGPSALLLALADELLGKGVDLSFDAYPFRRGCTLLAMPILPAALLSGPPSKVIEILEDAEQQQQLLKEWVPVMEASSGLGPEWSEDYTLAHIASDQYAWARGMTVRQASTRVDQTPFMFALDLLVASQLKVSVVIKVRDQRPYEDLAKIFSHPAHMVGSDGIFIGTHPHPRAWGTFAKFLRLFTRERGDFSWPDAARHLSTRAAERFGLTTRGRLLPGCVADIVLVDPAQVADMATYENPREDAVGIDDVFVNGQHVLAHGELTGSNPGRSLKRMVPLLETREKCR